jgi:very-short-patch-repair endonuclease
MHENEYVYSFANYHYPLCRSCQRRIEECLHSSQDHTPTVEASILFLRLVDLGVEAELEKQVYYKGGSISIDIGIPIANLNIEVDGIQHHNDPNQAVSDVWRNYYAIQKGYYTLHIPNSVFIDEDCLNSVVDVIMHLYESGRSD